MVETLRYAYMLCQTKFFTYENIVARPWFFLLIGIEDLQGQ